MTVSASKFVVPATASHALVPVTSLYSDYLSLQFLVSILWLRKEGEFGNNRYFTKTLAYLQEKVELFHSVEQRFANILA